MIQSPLLNPAPNPVPNPIPKIPRAASAPAENHGAIETPRFDDTLSARSGEHSIESRNDRGSIDQRRRGGLHEIDSTGSKSSSEINDQEQPVLDEDHAGEDAEGVVAPVETGRRTNDAPIDDEAHEREKPSGDGRATARLSTMAMIENTEPARSADQAALESAQVDPLAGADDADGAELNQATGVASPEPGQIAQVATEEPIAIISPALESEQRSVSGRRPADSSHQSGHSRVATETSEATRHLTTGERSAYDQGGEPGREDQSLASSARPSESTSASKEVRAEAVFQIDRIAEAGSVKSEVSANPILTARSERSQLSPTPTQAHGVDGRLVAQSVGRGLSAALQQGSGDVLIRLTPPSLGLVRVQMTLDHGAVSVRLETTTQAAQQILGDQIGALRQSLEARGLSVERLGVQHAPLAGAPNSQGAQHQSQHQQGSSSGAQQDLSGDQDAGGAPSKGRQDGQPDRGGDSGGVRREDSSFEFAFNESVSFHLEATA